MMWLDSAVIAISLLSILSVLVRADSTDEGLRQNLTINSLSSPWLKKVTNHSWPQRPGCWKTPWICKRGEIPLARKRCCRNQCVDVSSDVNHCGLCGITCPFTWQCCRGFCVDTNINPFNCGRCRNKCPWGVQCVYGMCGYALSPQPGPPFPFPPKPPKPWPPKPPKPRPPRGDEPPATSENT